MTTKYKDFILTERVDFGVLANYAYDHKTVSGIQLIVSSSIYYRYEYYLDSSDPLTGQKQIKELSNVHPNDVSEEHLNLILLKELSES